MRKSEYLTKLNYKDERLCYLLKNANHISQAQALLIVSRNRLENYEKQGVLKKLYFMDNNRKEIVYELTQYGREWVSKNFSNLRGNFYTSTGILHDVALAQEVIERTHSNCQWYTERDLRELLIREIQQSDNRWELMRMLENGQISVPDGGYIHDGSIECVEIINENYTSSHLAAKDRFQSITNIPITYIKQ